MTDKLRSYAAATTQLRSSVRMSSVCAKTIGPRIHLLVLSTRAEDAAAQIVRIRALHRAKRLQDTQPPIVPRPLPRLEQQPAPTPSYRR
jgi:hypothetical protein